MSAAPSSDWILDVEDERSTTVSYPFFSSLSFKYCSTAEVNCCLRQDISVILSVVFIGVMGDTGLSSPSSYSEFMVLMLALLMLLIPLSGDPVRERLSDSKASEALVNGFGFLFSFCFFMSLKLLRRTTLERDREGETESARDFCGFLMTIGDGHVVDRRSSWLELESLVGVLQSDCWLMAGMLDIELAFSNFLSDFFPCAFARRFFQKVFLDLGLSQFVVEILSTPVSDFSWQPVEILSTLLLLLSLIPCVFGSMSLDVTIILCLFVLALL